MPGVAVAVAVVPDISGPLPTMHSFSLNTAMWGRALEALPDGPQRRGTLLVANALATVLKQAAGMPIATEQSLLVMPDGCIQAACAYRANKGPDVFSSISTERQVCVYVALKRKGLHTHNCQQAHEWLDNYLA